MMSTRQPHMNRCEIHDLYHGIGMTCPMCAVAAQTLREFMPAEVMEAALKIPYPLRTDRLMDYSTAILVVLAWARKCAEDGK